MRANSPGSVARADSSAIVCRDIGAVCSGGASARCDAVKSASLHSSNLQQRRRNSPKRPTPRHTTKLNMSDAAAAQLSEHAGEAAKLSEPADDAAAPALVHLSLDALSISSVRLCLEYPSTLESSFIAVLV